MSTLHEAVEDQIRKGRRVSFAAQTFFDMQPRDGGTWHIDVREFRNDELYSVRKVVTDNEIAEAGVGADEMLAYVVDICGIELDTTIENGVGKLHKTASPPHVHRQWRGNRAVRGNGGDL